MRDGKGLGGVKLGIIALVVVVLIVGGGLHGHGVITRSHS